MFVEDDARLQDWDQLQQEICMAEGHQFYSFFKTPKQGSTCIYEHGTVAFYMQRVRMQQIIEATDRTACAYPIDEYMNTLGPWYATKQPVVAHIDSPRVRHLMESQRLAFQKTHQSNLTHRHKTHQSNLTHRQQTNG